jgi:hypothetical protein
MTSIKIYHILQDIIKFQLFSYHIFRINFKTTVFLLSFITLILLHDN